MISEALVEAVRRRLAAGRESMRHGGQHRPRQAEAAGQPVGGRRRARRAAGTLPAVRRDHPGALPGLPRAAVDPLPGRPPR